jgi:copper chaperone
MQTEQFDVLNVKCGGCAANIKNGLSELNGIQQVEVDIATGHVTVQGDGLDRNSLGEKLAELGYPQA